MTGLRVAVVGAGIAGLTLAVGLRRAGVDCVVYEQASAARCDDAGVQLSPNGTRLLRRLGLGPALERIAARPEAVEVRRWSDGRVVGWTRLGDEGEARYGAPYYTMARAQLHRLLLDAAFPDGCGDDYRPGRRLVGLREAPSGVQLSFMDGTVTAADLVVGADGVDSTVRAILAPDRPRRSDFVLYQGLVAADRLPSGAGERITVFTGAGQQCRWYRSGPEWFSLAAVVSAGPAAGHPAAAFAGWHHDVRQALAGATGLRRSELYQRPPLSRWHSDRVAVVGDAAAPLLPFGGQGANQAIESAATLAACLLDGDDIAPALRRYARIRAPRSARVAGLVQRHARDLRLADGGERARRDRALSECGPNDYAWLFGYDAANVDAPAATALAGAGAGSAVPVT